MMSDRNHLQISADKEKRTNQLSAPKASTPLTRHDDADLFFFCQDTPLF